MSSTRSSVRSMPTAALAGSDAAPSGGTNAEHRRQKSDLPDRLLDVHEAAEMLGLAPATLYDWAYQRKIPVVKPSGPRGPLRFRLSTLQGLIAKWERPALRPLAEKELDGRGRAGGGQQS